MVKPPLPFTWMLCGSSCWLSPVKTTVEAPTGSDLLADREIWAPFRKTLTSWMVLVTGSSSPARAVNGSRQKSRVERKEHMGVELGTKVLACGCTRRQGNGSIPASSNSMEIARYLGKHLSASVFDLLVNGQGMREGDADLIGLR